MGLYPINGLKLNIFRAEHNAENTFKAVITIVYNIFFIVQLILGSLSMLGFSQMSKKLHFPLRGVRKADNSLTGLRYN